MNRLAIALSLVVVFLSCSKRAEETAGGSPGETTNGIQAFVIDRNGVPAPTARVYLYDMHTLLKVDSSNTDVAGNFTFAEFSLDSFGVEIVNFDSSEMAWVPKLTPATVMSYFALRKSCLLTLNAPAGDAPIQLLGTPYTLSAQNGVSQTRIPQGTYAMTSGLEFVGFAYANDTTITVDLLPLSSSTASSSSTSPSSSVTSSSSKTAISSPASSSSVVSDYRVMIEDFNDGDNRPLFAPYWPISTGNWWLGQNDTAMATFPRNTESFTDGISSVDAWSGNSMHVQYWIIQWIGFRLGRTMDFTALDSVCFAAKGSGSVKISLEHIANPDSLADPFIKTVWSSHVSSQWKRYCIQPSDSSDADFTKAEWSTIEDHIEQLTIFFQGGNEAWIDDITFYGIPTSEWVK